MDMAKNQQIKSFCQPNAILTFAEYLEDFASANTRMSGYAMLDKLVEKLDNPQVIINELKRIKQGQRDIYH